MYCVAGCKICHKLEHAQPYALGRAAGMRRNLASAAPTRFATHLGRIAIKYRLYNERAQK